jgi:hypothetical protein
MMNDMINETIIEHFSNIDKLAVLNRYLALYFIFQKGIVTPEELAKHFGWSMGRLYDSLDGDSPECLEFSYWDEKEGCLDNEIAFDLYDVACYIEISHILNDEIY